MGEEVQVLRHQGKPKMLVGVPKIKAVGASERVLVTRSYNLKVPGVTQGRCVVAG